MCIRDSPIPHHTAPGEPRCSIVTITSGEDDYDYVFKVLARHKSLPDRWESITFSYESVIGTGSYGLVMMAKLHNTNETVAIKKVFVDQHSREREVNIMRGIDHCNTTALKYFFYTSAGTNGAFLNLVMEFLPRTLHDVIHHHVLSVFEIKLYSYQLCRALSYMHNINICHRDVKPYNNLLDPQTGVLKLCDFGSSKVLVAGGRSAPYMCSRYYRAPEMLLGSERYTDKVDVWSAGCVLAEMFLRRPIFESDGTGQIMEIVKVLGIPTRQDLYHLNPSLVDLRFPRIQAEPWDRIFGNTPPRACLLYTSPSPRDGLLSRMPSSA